MSNMVTERNNNASRILLKDTSKLSWRRPCLHGHGQHRSSHLKKKRKEKLHRQKKLSLHQLRKRRHIGSEEPLQNLQIPVNYQVKPSNFSFLSLANKGSDVVALMQYYSNKRSAEDKFQVSVEKKKVGAGRTESTQR
eukprot:1138503-Pelagomonas_calceolata.AAC.3